ncbi:MAG: DNA translocase FtsK, partial [Gaiellaceae bacterium]
MARRRKKRALKPRTPSRVKRRKKVRRERSHHHPELTGLGLCAVGLFLATLTYLGWEGGRAGGWVEDAIWAVIGDAGHLLPASLVVVGGLMLGRSAIVELRPFRTGIGVTALGLMLVLGGRGGYVGRALEEVVGTLVGRTGMLIAGITALTAGLLLLSGASVGALLRSSAPAVRRARTAARQTFERAPRRDEPLPPPVPLRPRNERPVDGVSEFPEVVGQAEPAPLLTLHDDEPTEDSEQQALFEPPNPTKADYVLPEPSLLKRSPAKSNGQAGSTEQAAQAVLRALADFGIEARLVGEITGPRVTRYELQLQAGTKMSKVAALKDDLSYALATTEIRILAPIPGKQAVGIEVPNLSPNLVTLGDVFDDLPSTASPLAVWLGKDISGNA